MNVEFDQNAHPAASVDAEALMAAFLQGAGLPGVSVNWQLTPEFMEMLGKLLATSVDGTFKLLSARANLKREVNADATMVVVRNNNPIKFLSDSPTVLTQMLRKKMPGFMGPVEALDDAFDDLQAHQQCMVAGMQGAIGEALHRLDPQVVAEENPANVLAVIPFQRKASLWKHYSSAHAQLAQGVQGDFQGVFGAAFAKAYERQLEKIQDGKQ